MDQETLQDANAVIARLEDPCWLIAVLEDDDEDMRWQALCTLGKLEPATLAQHADAVIARLEDSDEQVRVAALKALRKLEPATLALHADAVVSRLEDCEEKVRQAALRTLSHLEPATLAQHADAVVTMLENSDGHGRYWAMKTLGKLEPAALAQHAYALLPIFEANSHYPAKALNAKSILRRGLPRFVRHGIDFDDKDMASYDLSRRLLGRLGWYKLRLRLHAQRLALYWYALPYRPSGPGHAQDVEAWGRIGISSKRSRSD